MEVEKTVQPPSRRTSISGEEEEEVITGIEPPAAQTPPKPRSRSPSPTKAASKEDSHLVETGNRQTDNLLVFRSEELERDKENLSQLQVLHVEKPRKPHPPPKPQFKKRSTKAEEEALMVILERGLDREDVQMFKLALCRMKTGEEEERMIATVPWAHYPYIILLSVEGNVRCLFEVYSLWGRVACFSNTRPGVYFFRAA